MLELKGARMTDKIAEVYLKSESEKIDDKMMEDAVELNKLSRK